MSGEDLIRILTQTGLFLAAVFLGVFIAPENPGLVLGICVGVMTVILLAKLGRSAWILYPLSAGFSGTINLIPGGLTFFNIATILLIFYCLYFLKADPDFRFKLGPFWAFGPLLILQIILIISWIRSGDLGLNILGSSKVGGKGYISSILPFFGYIAAISLHKENDKLDPYLPLFLLAGYFFDAIIFVLSTIFPYLAPLFFKIYDVINFEAFQTLEASKTAKVDEGFVLRFGRTGHLAYVMMAAILVYFPFYSWLRLPYTLIGPLLSLIAFFFSIISGFRNYLVRFIIVVFLGLWQAFRAYMVFFLIPIFGFVLFLCFAQGNLFELPHTIQRTLVFLPGNWDKALSKSASGSAEFRKDIRRVYFSEFFSIKNFFGEGFLYDRSDLAYSQEQFWKRIGFTKEMDEDENIRAFITRRAHHEGLINIHHISGHLGTLAWILFCFFTFFNTLKYSMTCGISFYERVAAFGANLTCMMIFTFWLLFGSIKDQIAEILSFLFIFVVIRKRFYFDKVSN